MTRSDPSFHFHRTLLALAVCAAFLPAHADEPVKIEEGSVRVGVGVVPASAVDRGLFGQYNGLRSARTAVGTLGFDYMLRDDENETWMQVQGSNLLGDTREFNLVWKNPGEWKLTADYGELVRFDPNTLNTGLIGIGSRTPQVVNLTGGPGTGTDVDLSTKRTGLGIGFAKWLSPSTMFELDLKSERKDGARMFGVGMNCPTPVAPGCAGTTGISAGWALLMLPEPIDSTHNQVEARLSYGFEKLRFNVGYYGSFYRNANGTMGATVPASLNNPLGVPMPLSSGLQGILGQPIALAPDSQAHQLDFSGNYDFTPTTRATFKLAYANASQSQNFAAAGLGAAPAGVLNLGGEVVTKLAKFGLSARPVPKLSLLADMRYEDKDDRTPLARYNLEGAGTSAATYTNQNLPYKKLHGKLLANWQFNSAYRGSVGADYEDIDRGIFTATAAASGISALRQKTKEVSVHAEVRRRMTEDMSGALNVSSARRDGSDWLRDNSGTGVTAIGDPSVGFFPTAIFMPTLADRRRDKIKLFADWQPSSSLAIQVGAEQGKDYFNTPSNYGLRGTDMGQYSLDWSYALSETWALNGYASRGLQTLNQARPAGYVMAFQNASMTAGLGVTGKLAGTVQVGGSLTYMNDRSVFDQTLDTFAGSDSVALMVANGGLPDVVLRQTAVKMFAKFPVDKQSSIRLDVAHLQSTTSDWAWGYNGVPFTFSDGTTLSQKQSQNVGYVGLTYFYVWP